VRDLYCCFSPHCEVLRACRSGFQFATLGNKIANISSHFQLLKFFYFRFILLEVLCFMISSTKYKRSKSSVYGKAQLLTILQAHAETTKQISLHLTIFRMWQ